MDDQINHYELASDALKRADQWIVDNDDWASLGRDMSQDERLAHRSAELREAQVHATLYLAQQGGPQTVRIDAP